mgnify:CR=1 FL=1
MCMVIVYAAEEREKISDEVYDAMTELEREKAKKEAEKKKVSGGIWIGGWGQESLKELTTKGYIKLFATGYRVV